MKRDPSCPGLPRRTFLADVGMGVTGMALGSLLGSEAEARPSGPDGRPHFPPRAKSVIWIFLCGGVSPMESFDPKPALAKYAGMKIPDTPFREILDPAKNPFQIKLERTAELKPILPPQIGFRRHGKSGIEVSDCFPHLARRVDDMAVVRSFWTTSALHVAQLEFATGRAAREGGLPSAGAWVTYGLGSLNENLPRYAVLGKPSDSCCGGDLVFGAGYLGPQYAGLRLQVDPREPLDYLRTRPDVLPREREAALRTLRRLHGLVEYPDDPQLAARIRAFELAARMQSSLPEAMDLDLEPEETRELYGLGDRTTRDFGRLCLAARRLAERGVRFIQVFHQTSGFGPWDAHRSLVKEHAEPAAQVDRPIAGLLMDLKRRGLFEDVVVVGATEFGRTPTTAMTQDGHQGREHNPFGFTCWLAGAGIRGGVAHGATDELGYHAVERRHYVTDLHATVLRLLGLDSRRLEVPGRRRLDIDHGLPIREILA